jgi:protease-4
MSFKQFCMTALAVVAGFFITGVLGVLGMFYLLIQMTLLNIGQQYPATEKHSILYLDLNNEIVERTHGMTLQQQLRGEENRNIALSDIIESLKIAAEDPKIEGVYIDCGGVSAGIASLMSINEALTKFHESGKWIAAYGDEISQADYLLASTADSLWLNPVGEVEIQGIGSGLLYFKGLLDKLGIEMQVIKVGTYKSAVEPYILTAPSEANLEQIHAYINPLWSDICTAIGKGRKVAPSTVNAWADSIIETQNPETFPKRKIVTALHYRYDAEQALKAMSGIDADDDLRLVEPAEYLNQSYAHKYIKDANDADYNIAILYAEGDIVQDGKGGIVGADMAPLIHELADDDDVSALVLRVNSGGGSAFASEQIWNALQYFKSKDKPFYVSMGDVAASGGYYISCGADKIFCQPTTITGSIGIFGLIPCIEGLTQDKLGINYSLVATNPNAVSGIFKPFTPAQRNAMQSMINRGYETFVGRCAAGRHMSVDSIKAIAEGRVWAGSKALEIGLVDKLGTLDDCIKQLAEDNNVSKYSISKYPEPEAAWWQQLIEDNAQMRQDAIKKELGIAYPLYKEVEALRNMDRVQARMPFTILF